MQSRKSIKRPPHSRGRRGSGVGGRVCTIPQSNISRQEWEAIKDLHNDESIVILKVDKGNATVVLEHSSYQQKVNNILQNEAFKVIPRDPTSTIERTVTKLIKATGWAENIQIALKPKASSPPPRFYVLPKIHKRGCP